jgi:hypothetical protein
MTQGERQATCNSDLNSESKTTGESEAVQTEGWNCSFVQRLGVQIRDFLSWLLCTALHSVRQTIREATRRVIYRLRKRAAHVWDCAVKTGALDFPEGKERPYVSSLLFSKEERCGQPHILGRNPNIEEVRYESQFYHLEWKSRYGS